MSAKNAVWMDLPLLGGGQLVTRESNPVAWNYYHGSDMGGNLDQARMEAWEEDWENTVVEVRRRLKDWHHDVPQDCWRTRDGTVVNVRSMTDDHLMHATRFARTFKKHHSRLKALLTERSRRDTKKGTV